MIILAFLIVAFIFAAIFWKPIVGYFAYQFAKKEIKTYPRIYKAGIGLAVIPLALLVLMLLLGGTDGAVVMMCLVLPFALPAIGSGFLISFIVRKLVTKEPNDGSTSSQFTSYTSHNSPSNDRTSDVVCDTTYKEVAEDPNGNLKDLIWKANNPQPKNLPNIRR